MERLHDTYICSSPFVKEHLAYTMVYSFTNHLNLNFNVRKRNPRKIVEFFTKF